MTNPNIVNVTTIYGNTAVLAVGTSMANVVQNASSSNYLYKINTLFVTNANTGAIAVTLELNQAGTNTALAKTVNVPPNSVIVLLAKDTGLYLLENTSLQLSAGSASSITAICSYEQISSA